MAWNGQGSAGKTTTERGRARKPEEDPRLVGLVNLWNLLIYSQVEDIPKQPKGRRTDRQTDFTERRKKERKWLNVIVYVENQSIILNRSYYPPITHRQTDWLRILAPLRWRRRRWADKQQRPWNSSSAQYGKGVVGSVVLPLLHYYIFTWTGWEGITAPARGLIIITYMRIVLLEGYRPPLLSSIRTSVRTLVSLLLPHRARPRQSPSWYSCSMWVSWYVISPCY